MLIACLYSEWEDPRDGKRLLSFAPITDDPPAEVREAGHDRMIVNIQAQNIGRWLTPEGRPGEELQAIQMTGRHLITRTKSWPLEGTLTNHGGQ